jgi:hypothetical protein
MPPALKIDVPQEAPFVQATLEHSHVRMRIKPNEEAQLAYELAIPKTWAYASSFGPVASGPYAERGIGIFAGGGDAGSPVIAVTVMPSPFEIPIDAWAHANFESEGWQVVSAFWFPGASGLYFDITATRIIEDKPEARRSSVRVRGNDVFSVNCMCALEHWNAVKEIFWVAHATFEVEVPGAETMEPWFAFPQEKPPSFTFAHPASWLSEPVAAAPEGVSARDVRLVDVKVEELLGYLQVKAEQHKGAPVPTLEQRKADAFMHMQRSGITPNEVTLQELTKDSDPRSIAVPGWLGGYVLDGENGGSEVSMRLGFVERDEIAFTFMTLGPRLRNNPLVALRTQRVFEIARATLELADESAAKPEE